MNWKKINQKFPKSMKLLTSGSGGMSYKVIGKSLGYGIIGGLSWAPFELRELYDFFDDQGVYIDVTYGVNDWKLSPWFTGCIYNIPVIMTKQYRSRRKAENAVFKEAFKILEGKLTSNINTT